jgi:circadian clock protein KaiB
MTVVVSLTSATRRKLNLYIAGETPATFRARTHCRALQSAMSGIDIEEVDVLAQPAFAEAAGMVDVLAQPAFAEAAGILATPTLSDDTLSPPRRVVGDLGDIDRVIQFLGIEGSSQ